MFRLRYPVGAKMKVLMQGSLKPLDEVPISVSDRFLIRALSPDKNVMIEVVIPQTAFEVFEVDKETSVTVERDQFLKAIRRATRRDSISLEFEEGSRTLRLTLVNTRTGAERTYNIDVREVGVEPVGSINVDLPVKFQIPADDFRKIVRDAKIIDENLEFIYVEGRIEVVSRSENKLFKQLLTLDKPLYTLESKESSVTGKYDLDILKGLIASVTATDVVTVEFGHGLPLKIYLEIGDGSSVTYWVAPKV